jgi:hypothetical protein
MSNYRLIYDSLISLWLIAMASCSQSDWEQEMTGAGKDETLTRADLIEYTINVETAGTLDSLAKAGSYSDAQKLILTGNIAYKDVNYVDVNMTTVEVLDLAGTSYESESISGAFLSDSTQIKEISLPGNITSIERRAFYGCSSLTSITLPESLTSIGSNAFSDCGSLTSITIPEGVTSIEWSAFSGCSSLTSINIPEGVTSIGDWTFSDCSSLTSITLPESLTSIGYVAFSYCRSLTSIMLPESLTSIGDNAFSGCSSLTSITLPESLTSIGEYAFYGCSSLTSITIPEGVTSIERRAFHGCSSLTSITLPEGLTSIGFSAFGGCSSLTSITLPESLTSIGSYAFSDCGSLTSITIPEGVTSIEWSSVFSGCSSLQKVVCNSSGDINDLSSSSNLYCWLIINRPDGNLPVYGPNWKNVVINGVAEKVTLPYKEKVGFTIPEEVKSIKKISYAMTFDTNSSSSYGKWKTITLPFTPTRITHAEKGTLAPFDSGIEGAKSFWLRELTTEGFKDVTQIEPNHPYLIAMPYSKEYADKYNISGEVTFSAENLTSENFENNIPLSAEGTNYTMYASYSYMGKEDGVYVLNSSNQFVNNFSSVYPFEAYLKANTATLRSVISLNQGRAATRAGDEGKRKPQIDDM